MVKFGRLVASYPPSDADEREYRDRQVDEKEDLPWGNREDEAARGRAERETDQTDRCDQAHGPHAPPVTLEQSEGQSD